MIIAAMRGLSRTAALLPALLLAWPAARPAVAEATAQLPVEAFFADPVESGARLSSDGRQLVAIFSRGDEQYVFTLNLETKRRRPLVRFPKRDLSAGRPVDSHLSSAFFVGDRIVFALDHVLPFSGRPFAVMGLYAVDREGGETDDLSHKWLTKKFFAFGATPVEQDPKHVLVEGLSLGDESLETFGSSGREIQQVDVQTGERRLHQRGRPEVDGWMTDYQGRVRVGFGYRGPRRFVYAVSPSGSIDLVREYRMLQEPGFDPVGFGEDSLYVLSNHESDTYGLYSFDLGTKTFGDKLFGHPQYDVYGVVISEWSHKLLAASYVDDVRKLHFFDEGFARQMGLLERALPDRSISVESRNRAEDRWIVEASGDVHPPVTYLYEPGRKQLMVMFEKYPQLRTGQLSPSRAVEIQARDGLALRGYLTIPRGRPESKLPSVLLIHGGPWARDSLVWDPEVQFLASRGYAVLRLNFRGSSGFGNKFEMAGYRQWGLAMQDDVADAAKWLIDQGIADPDRIAIYGASYGGYAALMGSMQNPELFRCAVSLAGVTQIPKMLAKKQRVFGRTTNDLNLEMVGDWVGDAEHLRSVSPAENAERVGVPVLIAQGDMDLIVRPEQAQLMADALTRAGKPFELLMLENEPHGLLFEATRLVFYRALEAFLAKHMQPRPQPAPALVEAPAP